MSVEFNLGNTYDLTYNILECPVISSKMRSWLVALRQLGCYMRDALLVFHYHVIIYRFVVDKTSRIYFVK